MGTIAVLLNLESEARIHRERSTLSRAALTPEVDERDTGRPPTRAAVTTSKYVNLATLAKMKLATQYARGGELDRLERVLHQGESVITLGDALFRTGRQERRGLLVLTDQRLICLESGTPHAGLLEIWLTTITSLESHTPRGSGDAKRGEVTIVADGINTNLARIRPWERTAEIVQYIRATIADQVA